MLTTTLCLLDRNVPRYVVSFMMLLFVFSNGKAQTDHAVHFKKAKIYLVDHHIVKARNLVVGKEDISFLKSNPQKETTLSRDRIALLKIPKGTHVWEGAAFGSATMAISALLIDSDTDPLGRPQEKDADFYFTLIGIGAAVGALIGLLFPKWKPLSLKSTAVNWHTMSFKPYVLSQRNAPSINITIAL